MPPTSPSSPSREGGCLCGAIRYRLRGQPLTLYACHCTDCQRQSGSAFGMSMVVLRTDFEIVTGTPRTFTKTYPDDGRQKIAHFCGDCGSRVYLEFSIAPQVVGVKPGTLDDTRGLDPIAHIWTASAQPWVAIPELEMNDAHQPQNMMRLIEAYQSRAK